MLDVGGGQPQRLDLAQLPVQRLGGDEVPETGEGGVDTLGPVPLSHVGDGPGLLLPVGDQSDVGAMFVTRLPHHDCSATAGGGAPPLALLASHWWRGSPGERSSTQDISRQEVLDDNEMLKSGACFLHPSIFL